MGAKNWRVSYREQRRLDDLKKEICKALQRICNRNRLTLEQMAEHMGTSRSRASEALNAKLDRLTLDQLFIYLVLVAPEFKFLIAI